ncbi:PSMG1 protein, partial [Atractosteus spatula]|nr:PSMG1 protein [Atractosteus spatula]
MATFFGEVLSVYSRAVEEDEDELEDESEEDMQIRREIENKREVHVHWSSEIAKSTDKPFQCSDFIIAVGHNATGFLSAFVLSSGSWEAVGSASLWNERSRSSSQPAGEPSCGFYRSAGCSSVLICLCTCFVAEDQLFQWTEKVFGFIQTRGLQVLVLSDASVSEYTTADPVSASPVPFLRALKSSAYKNTVHCPVMEQPNIVTGLPAAVLSHCQVHQIPAVLYQCYSDVISPDTITMETYKPALPCLSKLVTLDSSPSIDVLRKVVKSSESQSNLYT